MRRGDIWLVDLEPVLGSKATKRRPAVIVSTTAPMLQLPGFAGGWSPLSR